MYGWYTKYARHNVPSHAADAPHSASDSRASLHRSGKDSIVLMRLAPLDAYDRQNSQCQRRWIDQARCSMNHLDSREDGKTNTVTIQARMIQTTGSGTIVGQIQEEARRPSAFRWIGIDR